MLITSNVRKKSGPSTRLAGVGFSSDTTRDSFWDTPPDSQVPKKADTTCF